MGHILLFPALIFDLLNQFNFRRWKEKLCVADLFFKSNSQTQPFGLQQIVQLNVTELLRNLNASVLIAGSLI